MMVGMQMKEYQVWNSMHVYFWCNGELYNILQILGFEFIIFVSLLVLEFELRKAHDTIKSLRGSLTKASDIHSKGDEIRQNQTNKDVNHHMTVT